MTEESPLSVSVVRDALEGLRIIYCPPNKEKEVQRLRDRIGELLNDIARSQGLALGTDPYEDLNSDFSFHSLDKFEQETLLSPTQIRLFRGIEVLLAGLRRDPSIKFSTE